MAEQDVIVRDPDTRQDEGAFREQVRDVLDLDWSTRNETILVELKRLKARDAELRALEA